MAEGNRPSRADTLRSLSVDRLQRGRLQPRQAIDGPALARLAQSVQSEGVLQPLFVRKVGLGTFEILAGERRWHAAKMAGLRRVPTVVRNVSDARALAISLVENLHREDLNPMDQAVAIQRLVADFSMTHAQVAETIGRSRATVSNLLRLLELPAEVRAMIAEGKLDMGHGRALLALPPDERLAMAETAVAEGLSVREVERRAYGRKARRPIEAREPEMSGGGASEDDSARKGPARALEPSPPAGRDLDWLSEGVRQRLGADNAVRRQRDGRWRLDIGFTDLAELAQALAAIEQLLEEQSTSEPALDGS